MTNLKLSVVIPCYNEQSGLEELCRRVTQVCVETVSNDYELVLVNDGSTDATWPIMQQLCTLYPPLRVIDLSRNYGHQLALSAGLKFCRGERIFILDADLQDPPELLPAMMARMDEGVDVVYGQRSERAGESAFKKVTAHIFYRTLNKLIDIKVPPDTGDFRLMSRQVLNILNDMPEHYRFIRGMVSWIGFRQEAMTYQRAPRFAGQTHYGLSKMLKLAADAVTGFSVRPLRLASYAGLICGVGALVVLFFSLIEYLFGDAVRGWTSLAVLILIIGSIQMFIIGIIGEYIGRLYMESKGRPLYIVREVRHGQTSTRTGHEG